MTTTAEQKQVKRVIVYHSGYGCDTGCCGHVIEVREGDEILASKFLFQSPGYYDKVLGRWRRETSREFAERIVTEKLGQEHVKDLDWEHCEIVDD